MNFASQSEVRIAQEFEKRGILFFPLALGVRAHTSENWRDHKEADFLVCDDGVWGILEVSFHPNRFDTTRQNGATIIRHTWWTTSSRSSPNINGDCHAFRTASACRRGISSHVRPSSRAGDGSAGLG
jgi:hypothetical protein